MIPKETAGELFEDALARVRRCIGGGMATGTEDEDSDLQVIADSITVNLRCPVSYGIILYEILAAIMFLSMSSFSYLSGWS